MSEADELAELVGELPESEPASPFDSLDALLDAPEDVRRWGLRKLVEKDPTAALQVVLPASTMRESVERAFEYSRQRRQRQVRRMLDEEEKQEQRLEAPGSVRLTDLLAEPDEDVEYRVDGLWPRHGRIVLAAQNKSGKTTLIGNLIRSLVDGDPFLDRYDVDQVGRVVLIDNESSRAMIRRWLGDQGIINTEWVEVFPLRGHLSSFDLLDEAVRAEWAERIGPADVLVFDCLRPALDSLGLSEDKDAGRFLVALDELCAAAGIKELAVVHHMGHSNERSRGDSRIEDWPDAKWKLVKEDPDDPRSARYFSAFGRDVDQPEVQLAYSDFDRRLTVAGGTRREARATRTEADVWLFIRDNPGSTQTAVERGVTGDRMTVRRAIRALADRGELRVEVKGQSRLHYAENVETSRNVDENGEN